MVKYTQVEFGVGALVIAAKEIMLFDSAVVSEIATLMGEAQGQMAGSRSGIGFWGSPAWVLGGSLVLGAIEGAVSRAAAKEGVKSIARAVTLTQKLLKEGMFVSVSKIENVELAVPQAWASLRRVEIEADLSSMSSSEQLAFRAKHNLSRYVVGTMKVQEEATYVHNGDEFIGVLAADGPRYIRWSAVNSYRALA